jgi:hypothetical protein
LPVFFAVFSSVANSGHKPEMVICLEERGWNGLRVMSVTTVMESSRGPWSHQFVTKISPIGRELVSSCCCHCTTQCDHAKSSLGLVMCRRLCEQWISHGVLQWWSQSNAHWGMEKYIFDLQLLPVLLFLLRFFQQSTSVFYHDWWAVWWMGRGSCRFVIWWP